MKMIVGLGNPEPKYELTRHNAGFLMVDLLADRAGAALTVDKKFQGETGRGHLLGESILFLKPHTYMNLSGRSVLACWNFYKIDPEDVVVIHDDIDVPPGKVKAKIGGGHGGNNGIRSIIQETGQAGFHRLKLGVGKPGPESKQSVSSWVLGRMTEDELKVLESEMIDNVLLRLEGIFR